ncbi:MAG: hypothetical protein M1819_004591 [Sarea resinae]|nr:MAG: hypothetical protein M1819_006806 [Sarea resinae]KAI9832047.1 MAG: hypothetical protein M1819_004591 [Sarea resinae]
MFAAQSSPPFLSTPTLSSPPNPKKSAAPAGKNLEPAELASYLRYTPFVVHVQMYALADKYGVPLLAKLADEKFKNRLNGSKWNVPSLCMATEQLYQLPPFISQNLRKLIVA